MRSTKQHRNRTAWGVEALESRLLLDGDVTAALRGSDLIVGGDAADNQILISQPNPGTIRIAGLEGTKVNGKKSVDLPRASGDLTILMEQGGEDRVAIQGPFDVRDALRGNLDAGEFLVEGSDGPVNIGGDLTVSTGDQGHVTIRNEVRVGGDTSIHGGLDANVIAGRATLPDFAAARFRNSLRINNPYFPVVRGAAWTYNSEAVDEETGQVTHETLMVEAQGTRTIQGVEVRVVRDRVYREGILIEDTFDFYAQDDRGNVWYFGEDVTNFEFDDQGKLIGTNKHGSWEAGVGGSHAGIIMEARPRIGYRYFQEFSPDNVMDQAVGLATNETATNPVAQYTRVFRTLEASVVEPLSLAHKQYAPGVGIIAEFELDIEDDEVTQTIQLVSLKLNGRSVTQLVPTRGFTGINTTGRFIGGAEFNDDASIEADGPVILNGAEFAGKLDAATAAQLIAVDTVLSDDASFLVGDSLSLKGVTADGTVDVRGKLDNVHIFNSDISEFDARFGPADDSMVVKDSEFDALFADGGPGRNTFERIGNNVFGKLTLRRFVEV